jgi:hypothetical protein
MALCEGVIERRSCGENQPGGLRGSEAGVGEDSDRAVRTARNESLFREINERVKELNEAFDALSRSAEWICECGNTMCLEPIQMPRDEYEAVRTRGSNYFFVKPDAAHVVPDVDVVVEQHDRYRVVQKIGVAAEIAEKDATGGA